MRPTPEQALADRLDRLARRVEGSPAEGRSLVIVIQRWDAAVLVRLIRAVAKGCTAEQAAGWCARMTRTLVRIGPAAVALGGENACHVPGVMGACLVRDAALDRFVRPLPPFQGKTSRSGLVGLSVDRDDGDGSRGRRVLWLDVADDDLARSVVDVSHVLAEASLLMDDDVNAGLRIEGGPLPEVCGDEVIYRRVVMPRDSASPVWRAWLLRSG